MLHHVSFNARDPAQAAEGLADLLLARAFRAPSPPFPSAAWFVCVGDDQGSLIEVMPWGETRDPSGQNGVGHDAGMRPTSGAHVLASTARHCNEVFAIAGRYRWRAEKAHAGLFEFIKVWIEDAFLIEFLTPETRPAYVSAFNAQGLETLDDALRRIERQLAAR